MLLSSGVLVKSPDVIWSGSTPFPSLDLSGNWTSYGAIYKRQLWVAALVNKRAAGQARLPLKVYERADNGRTEVPTNPYGVLLYKPNQRYDRKFFWRWTRSTRDIYGEALWLKERDRGGRPVQLHLVHPTTFTNELRGGRVKYEINTPTGTIHNIDESDVVHFRNYNPETTLRGLSLLEPLRFTLEHEDAARRATSAFWRNGGRPSVVLSTPNAFRGPNGQQIVDRIRLQWDEIHSGADNFGKVAILEEALKPEVLSMSAADAQYAESRQLNREEACAIFDTPPPVVHILDHATFSNITEQMRSMYRDTMAPLLGEDEAILDLQLRQSTRRGRSEPDFSEDVYAEFLMDEVLRGDFEQRMDANQKAINSGQMTPNEARTMENRPELPGGERLYINSTMVPLEMAGEQPQEPMPTQAPPEVVRALMGRLSRQSTLDDVDARALTAGLNGHSAAVLAELEAAKSAGETVAQLRDRIKGLARDSVEPLVVNVGTVNPPDVHIESLSPVVNVTLPDNLVAVSTPKPGTRRVERDKAGNISRIVDE